MSSEVSCTDPVYHLTYLELGFVNQKSKRKEMGVVMIKFKYIPKALRIWTLLQAYVPLGALA